MSKQAAMAEIAQAWGKYFGTHLLTPFNMRKIETYVEDGMSAKVIIYAIKLATRKADYPDRYLFSVLNRYFDKGILTEEQLERSLEDECRSKEAMAQYERANRQKTQRDQHKKYKSDEYR